MLHARYLGLALTMSIPLACGDEPAAPDASSADAPDAAALDDPDAQPAGDPDGSTPPPDAAGIANCSPTAQELLANPEFDDETGDESPWEITGDAFLAVDPDASDGEENLFPAHTYPHSVGLLKGVGGAASGKVEQRVQIPVGTTVLALAYHGCFITESISGDPDEVTISLEPAGGGEAEVLATISSDDGDEPCNFLPDNEAVDPSSRYDGEAVDLVISAETDDDDQATFYFDTLSLKASCP